MSGSRAAASRRSRKRKAAVADNATTIDLGGALLVPGFVDGHLHLDKTLLGLPFQPHRPGVTIAERIARERELRRELSSPVEDRAWRLIRQIVAVRHDGAAQPCRHRSRGRPRRTARAAARARGGARPRRYPDRRVPAERRDRFRRGSRICSTRRFREGADLVGGLDPAGIDNDVEGHLDAIFAIAERHGVGLDIHLHDPGPLGCYELRQIAARAHRAAGSPAGSPSAMPSRSAPSTTPSSAAPPRRLRAPTSRS